jgi:ATP-dependent Clp protease ATP-binding subunit ClpC
MFERFTDQARKSVVLAQEEARLLSHDHIGTEHLLAGLLAEEHGAAARALASAGLTLAAVRGQIETKAGRGQGPLQGHIPFTPRAKKAMELALRAAVELGQRIGTGHLLLGLIKQEDSEAVTTLRALGADPGQLRAGVLEEIGKHPEELAYSAPLHTPRASPRVRREPRLDQVQALLGRIEERLSAIERHLGIEPGHGGLAGQEAGQEAGPENVIPPS